MVGIVIPLSNQSDRFPSISNNKNNNIDEGLGEDAGEVLRGIDDRSMLGSGMGE